MTPGPLKCGDCEQAYIGETGRTACVLSFESNYERGRSGPVENSYAGVCAGDIFCTQKVTADYGPVSKKKKNFGTGVQISIQSTLRVKEGASEVKNGRLDMSAAAEHAIFEQHALDFDNVEVIDCERHGWKWRVKEALHINAKKHSMNKDGLIYWN